MLLTILSLRERVLSVVDFIVIPGPGNVAKNAAESIKPAAGDLDQALPHLSCTPKQLSWMEGEQMMESGQNMHKSKAEVFLRKEILMGAGNKTSPIHGDHSFFHIGSITVPS